MKHFARPIFGASRDLRSMARELRGGHATGRVALSLVALGVACLGLPSTNALAASTTTTTLSPAIIVAGNAYARNLLAALPIPPQAREVAALPTPDDLTVPITGAADVREARRFYLLPTSVSVEQYVRAHLPRGAAVAGTGSSGGRNVIPDYEISVSLTCVSRHITFCGVTYTTQVKDGQQELAVAVQVNYLPILHVTMPTNGVVTVTGYGKLSLVDASSEPSSVVLTRAQTLALRAAIVGLKDLGSAGGCMEDSLLLKINVVKNGKVVWRATADACPGGLTITSSTTTAILDNRACPFWHVVDSFFPSGTATATKTGAKSCNASQFQ
jgi:hypothetical protein